LDDSRVPGSTFDDAGLSAIAGEAKSLLLVATMFVAFAVRRFRFDEGKAGFA
jgi:hypothetical protein